MTSSSKTILNNKKARHEYSIVEEFEAGLVLKGTEVKSLRENRGSLIGAFCRFFQNELFVYGMNIPEYLQGNIYNHDPIRDRKLLLHKREIKKLQSQVEQKGLTLIPLSLYFKRGYAKVKIGLVKGKKLYDKREDIKKRTLDREINRSLKKNF
ncbi:SsrA-binding protein [PVC group bacterium (ex Bugula neritina AB1)]|nr:SsrA-binding protein [PVC group bacterium (ex Bugula neritina AB1)]